MNHPLQWQKFPVLNDGFICLVNVMGDDSSIVQAARVSYGKDSRTFHDCGQCKGLGSVVNTKTSEPGYMPCPTCSKTWDEKDRQLIRYLLNHFHTTPFEMVEFKFLVRVPMDCWRQWIRHRTANVNEYSTRYTEAIDSQQTTSPDQWRLQATDNKQGSSGFLSASYLEGNVRSLTQDGQSLTAKEKSFHQLAKDLYDDRLNAGIAKEQARKDLPLSTYTEAYWKCDLHNIFNFLRLRMDSHAQYEIRMYANAMAEIVKQVVPVAWEAFEDYVLHAKKFSRMEMEHVQELVKRANFQGGNNTDKTMTDREWKEFLAKLS